MPTSAATVGTHTAIMDGDPAAKTRAHRQINQIMMPHARAIFPFTKRCQVSIIPQADFYIKLILYFFNQVQAVPVGNIRDGIGDAGNRVERARRAKRNAMNLIVLWPDGSTQHKQAFKRRLFTLGGDRLYCPASIPSEVKRR